VADTNLENPIWSDSELLYFLSICNNVPEQAAAKAARAEAFDFAKLAFRLTLGNLGDDETTVHNALLMLATSLETRGTPSFAPQFNPPDRIFTQDRDGGRTLGSTHLWTLIPLILLLTQVVKT